MTFEQALEALDDAVSRLEAGNLSLEDAVALYEEGQRLARLCNDRLDAAELRLSQIGDAESGEIPEEGAPDQNDE